MGPVALARDLAVAASALATASALGFALEALAARRYFGLHLVPLGPGAGADVALDEPVPKPYGEHGWVPLPLGLLDVALVLASEAAPWGDDSRYKGEGRQLAANCAFSILPAVLAAWLLWMPWSCSPLPCVLAAAVAALGLAGAAFWADALPLLPRARANAASARRATRRALLCALHAPYWALCTAYLCRAPPNGARRVLTRNEPARRTARRTPLTAPRPPAPQAAPRFWSSCARSRARRRRGSATSCARRRRRARWSRTSSRSRSSSPSSPSTRSSRRRGSS